MKISTVCFSISWDQMSNSPPPPYKPALMGICCLTKLSANELKSGVRVFCNWRNASDQTQSENAHVCTRYSHENVSRLAQCSFPTRETTASISEKPPQPSRPRRWFLRCRLTWFFRLYWVLKHFVHSNSSQTYGFSPEKRIWASGKEKKTSGKSEWKKRVKKRKRTEKNSEPPPPQRTFEWSSPYRYEFARVSWDDDWPKTVSHSLRGYNYGQEKNILVWKFFEKFWMKKNKKKNFELKSAKHFASSIVIMIVNQCYFEVFYWFLNLVFIPPQKGPFTWTASRRCGCANVSADRSAS